jgi:VCBS repeat protein
MLGKGRVSTVIFLVFVGLGNVASALVGFKPAQNYPVGTTPTGIVLGDFNGDGKLDLVVANYGDPTLGDDGSISVLLGNGDGTFRSATSFVAVKNPTDMAAGNFDNDGKIDLAVVRRGDPAVNDNGDVTIFLSNGDGTFRQGQIVTTGKSFISVLAADFDLDQRADLAISQTDNSVSVLMGKGDGTFQAPVVYPTPTGNLGGKPLKVVDFNQDGIKDLAALDRGGDILLGNGDGTFRSGPSLPLELFTSFDLTEDFNGDGKVDLLATHCGLFGHGCSEQLLLGNGDGTFTGLSGLDVLVSGAYTPADFDGDGKLDLAGITTVNGNAVAVVFLGNGDGSFQAAANFPASSSLRVALADDLNGDNAPDLVMINSDNSIGVLLNSGTDFSLSASPLSPSSVTRGQSATSTVSLSLLNAFDNPVALSCTVSPAQSGSPACSLSSNTVSFDSGGKASATLSIMTGSSAASLIHPPYNRDSQLSRLAWLPVAGFAFVGAGLNFGLSRKRKLLVCLAGAVMFVGLLSQVACGGGGASSGPGSASYTVTVTGVSGSTQHSATVTLKVQ